MARRSQKSRLEAQLKKIDKAIEKKQNAKKAKNELETLKKKVTQRKKTLSGL